MTTLTRAWAEPARPVDPALPTTPWLVGDVLSLVVVNLIGLGMLAGGLLGTRHTTDPHDLLLLLDVAAAGLVVSLSGNAVFLLTGLRHAGQLRTELLGGRASSEPAPVAEIVAASAGLVAAPTMTHFHRDSCPAVRGKAVTVSTSAAHRKAGRSPCGLCSPEGGA